MYYDIIRSLRRGRGRIEEWIIGARRKFYRKCGRFGGMFIKIFVSFPTGQHAILSRVHDKRVVVGSHGIEPRDRKVPLGCFTSDHSKARSLSCILPRVSRVLGPGIPFSLSPTSFGQSKHIFEGWTSRRFILLIPLLSTSSSISSSPSRHRYPTWN